MRFKILLVVLLGTFARLNAQEIPSTTNLKPNHKYWTPQKKYFVIFQGDGNLVVYSSGVIEKPVWASNTSGNPGTRCEMQGDGNLVIYKENAPIWSSNSCCYPNKQVKLSVQDDGNLVVLACINDYWIPLWSWQTGAWTKEQIIDFPKTHPNGARCSPPPPPPPPTNNGIIYISWKSDQKCGCSTLGGGNKQYLYNTTNATYKVTIEKTTYAVPNYTSTTDYTIKPGEEVYIGCSQTAGSGCYRIDYTKKNQIKL